jgi:phage portal protein BeeE
MASALMATGPGGLQPVRNDLARSHEEQLHFRDWVYTSIRPIAQRIAGQSIRVGRKGAKRPKGAKQAGDGIEALDNHPLLDLLADPNDLMVGWSLIYTTVASMELTGRALWWLPGQKTILPIPTSWIVSFAGTTSFESFKVRPPHVGEAFDIPADECFYASYPNPCDPHGALSPLHAMWPAVVTDEAITNSQLAMFSNGIHPSHVVIVGKDPHPDVPGGLRPHLTGAQKRQIIEAIRRQYAGAVHHGDPFILDGLIEDVKRLSNTPSEMDWLNSGKMTKSRIMQGFGTNPIIAGEIEGANRASSLAAEDHFCNYTVNPKIELLSQCLTEWLSPMFGGDIVIWIEPCVPRDDDMRLRWATALATAGALTGDEMRELSPFNLPQGKFPDPILTSAQRAQQQMGKATEELEAAVHGMRSYTAASRQQLAGAVRRLLEPLANGEYDLA